MESVLQIPVCLKVISVEEEEIHTGNLLLMRSKPSASARSVIDVTNIIALREARMARIPRWPDSTESESDFPDPLDKGGSCVYNNHGIPYRLIDFQNNMEV